MVLCQVAEPSHDENYHKDRGISPEAVEKITDDKTQQELQMTEEEKKLMQEWETHMSDFVPEDITTVELDGRAEMVTATLRNPPGLLRGRGRAADLHQGRLLREPEHGQKQKR